MKAVTLWAIGFSPENSELIYLEAKFKTISYSLEIFMVLLDIIGIHT